MTSTLDGTFDALIRPERYHWDALIDQLPAAPEPERLERLRRLALASGYALQQLNRHPQWLEELLARPAFTLDARALEQQLAGLKDLNAIKQALRLARHRHLLEIICLDVCADQPVETSLEQLSELADSLIRAARQRIESLLARRHGQPLDARGQPVTLNVIGMGKLGGRELNFSSDIDLICVYREEGELQGFGKLSHRQFFTKVTQQLVQCLNEQTADGFVYRVDLRLRPWGDAGPVVLTHSAFEHYYQLHGRNWEQYAMVKARVITGSEEDREAILGLLRPFVYRRYHDYRVFEGLAQLKNSIDAEARRKGARDNIKIGRGGIREIEFFVQAFQILRGGRNHRLQTQSLLRALGVLAEEGIIEPGLGTEMAAAYRFLRRLENRIQMLHDQQTHQLPSDTNARARLALLLGFSNWDALMEQLDAHRDTVSAHFDHLFREQDSEESSLPALDDMEPETLSAYLAEQDFDRPDEGAARLRDFLESRALLYLSEAARDRLRAILPLLLKAIHGHAARANISDSDLLERLLQLLGAIAGRSVYYELLYHNRPLLDRLVQTFAASAWIAEQVSRYPLLLETLLYPGDERERFDREQLAASLQRQLDNVAGDTEMELDVLRQFRRAQTLVIASAEVQGEIDAMSAAARLSELAEILLDAVYRQAWQELTATHGLPRCRDGDQQREARFGIIGYGKLGGRELHYQSDLDIIFLHDSSGEQAMTSGPRVIDNSQFFARLAQKIITRLTVMTPAGKLYEIDTRLRPDGAAGMLVSSLQAYRGYQQDKAWTWEHQALIRARFVAGDRAIAAPFGDIRRSVLCRPRDEQALRRDIIEMRDRMYRAKTPPESDIINLKHSRGGLVDIEFLVQYRVLAGANKFASLCETTDNIGLLSALHDAGLIDDDCVQLRDIYRLFHQWLHARVLQNCSADIEAEPLRKELETVRACWRRWLD